MEIPNEIKNKVASILSASTGMPAPLLSLLFAAAETLVKELLAERKNPPPPRTLKAKMVDIKDIKDSLLARDVLNPPTAKVSELLFLLSESFRFYENEGHFDLEEVHSSLSEKVKAATTGVG
jgi:hypothetical protein